MFSVTLQLSFHASETVDKRDNFCHRMKDDGLFWSDWWPPARRASRSERRVLKKPAREPWNWKKAHHL